MVLVVDTSEYRKIDGWFELSLHTFLIKTIYMMGSKISFPIIFKKHLNSYGEDSYMTEKILVQQNVSLLGLVVFNSEAAQRKRRNLVCSPKSRYA